MHRRDPTQESDCEVGTLSDIGETTCSEVEHNDDEVGDQNSHVLVVCHCAHTHAEEASCRSHKSKSSRVNHQVTKSVVLELKAVEG